MTLPVIGPGLKIAVIGLGYVGLPLATAFGKRFQTLGFDHDSSRIAQLSAGHDATREVSDADIAGSQQLSFSDKMETLNGCSVFIVSVPTPIDDNNQPDLTLLKSACKTVAKFLSKGSVVVFESTVFPGATEEICQPLLESHSGLSANKDFFLGYSPERINPGDPTHRLDNIIKITSGSTPKAADFVDQLYADIIPAGTHKTASIRIAEAAKVIENTQRDLNIALINELAIIFDRMDLDTLEVLEAAGTKWNFLPFKPGLVGGHCISVDPYYLTYKARQLGYHPEVILAGRKMNDGMGAHVASRVIKLMAQNRLPPAGAKILILGLTYKENCPDLRNSRVIDIISELRGYNAEIDVYDPWVDPSTVQREIGLSLTEAPKENHYDAIILAVAHQEFLDSGIKRLRALGTSNHIFFDVKSLFPADQVDDRL